MQGERVFKQKRLGSIKTFRIILNVFIKPVSTLETIFKLERGEIKPMNLMSKFVKSILKEKEGVLSVAFLCTMLHDVAQLLLSIKFLYPYFLHSKVLIPFFCINLNPLHQRLFCAKCSYTLNHCLIRRWKCETFMTMITTTDNGNILNRNECVK